MTKTIEGTMTDAQQFPVFHKDRFDAVIAKIETSPEEWDQTEWHCGTKHCFAGHAQIMAGHAPNERTVRRDARVYLGLTGVEAERLFNPCCTLSDLKSFGFDPDGYDRDGFDRAGVDRAGFDRAGFDRAGFDRAGFDRAGFDRAGFDRDGFDRAGFDRAGFDRTGIGRAGFDRDGFDRAGFNCNGFDRDGFDRDGLNSMNVPRPLVPVRRLKRPLVP